MLLGNSYIHLFVSFHSTQSLTCVVFANLHFTLSKSILFGFCECSFGQIDSFSFTAHLSIPRRNEQSSFDTVKSSVCECECFSNYSEKKNETELFAKKKSGNFLLIPQAHGLTWVLPLAFNPFRHFFLSNRLCRVFSVFLCCVHPKNIIQSCADGFSAIYNPLNAWMGPSRGWEKPENDGRSIFCPHLLCLNMKFYFCLPYFVNVVSLYCIGKTTRARATRRNNDQQNYYFFPFTFNDESLNYSRINVETAIFYS